MSILVDENSRVLVQGITGREGSFHATRCMEYGTNVVAGVTPGRGGSVFNESVPVFDSVEEAVEQTGANVSLLFVPAPFAQDAMLEAADAGIELIACIAEGVPVLDSARVLRYLDGRGSRLLGPNCPGLISPTGKCKVGIMPGHIHKPGRVGVVSRSGTLTYEAVSQLSALDLGQSTCVGIGGDPLIGTNFVDVLELFNEDDDTDAGGDDWGDWREHGAGGGAVYQGEFHEAGSVLHCGSDGSSRKADGSRRSDYHGFRRDGGGEETRPWRTRGLMWRSLRE